MANQDKKGTAIGRVASQTGLKSSRNRLVSLDQREVSLQTTKLKKKHNFSVSDIS